MTGTGRPAAHRDAVVVLPGIMGSELVDSATGHVLWGAADARWYVRAWSSGESLARLAVTEEERAGRTGRVRATRLLRFPAFAPALRGFEPYTALASALRRGAAHPDAVLEFPYDWRLSIEHAAAGLARAADDHLRAWRSHPQGSRDARLVLVAHSMGGLVARYFTELLGGAREVRTVVTLGTPVHGSVKAAALLGSGRGGPLPLPHRRLRALAGTLPGLYDLLPGYRCVHTPEGLRRLTAGDVGSLGGDAELAQEALDRRAKLLESPGAVLVRPVIGVAQRTAQSLTLAGGTAELHEHLPEEGASAPVDRRGDGTVYRDAAFAPGGLAAVYLPQSHGALARSTEAIAHVGAVLTERPLGPPLGATEFGLEVPDLLPAGTACPIEADLLDNPTAVDCRVVDTGANLEVDHPRFVLRDGRLHAQARLPGPGLYRVEATSGGYSAVSQLVLVTDPLAEVGEAKGGEADG